MSFFSYFWVVFSLLSDRPPESLLSYFFVALNFSGFRGSVGPLAPHKPRPTYRVWPVSFPSKPRQNRQNWVPTPAQRTNRTKNTTATQNLVIYYAAALVLRPPPPHIYYVVNPSLRGKTPVFFPGKCQKSMGVHKILVRKIWFYPPPPAEKGRKWGKTVQISGKSSKLTLFRGGGGERNFMGQTILWTFGRFWKWNCSQGSSR